MNKIEFLSRLNQVLVHLPQQEREDILNDYEEHFRISAEMGKTEEETAKGLGSPEELGATYVEGESLERPEDMEIPDPSFPSAEDTPFSQPPKEDYGAPWDTPKSDAPKVPPQGYPNGYAQANRGASGDYASKGYYDSQGYFHPDDGGTPTPHQQSVAYANPQSPAHSAGQQTFYTVMILLLTIFIVVPVGFGLAVSFWFVIFSLALSAILAAVALCVFYFVHVGLVLLGAAALCLGVALILGLIVYTAGMVKLFSAYFSWCGRAISGEKKVAE